MNTKHILKTSAGILLALIALLVAAFQSGATGTNASPAAAGDKSKTAVQATNDPMAELPIPDSVFEIASKPTCDPFYPNSTRNPTPTANTNAVQFSAGSFTLKGLSGNGNNLLALINNRTVAAGEDAEVTTPTGKMKIHCVEIKEGSVIIKAESSPTEMEIFLRKSAR